VAVIETTKSNNAAELGLGPDSPSTANFFPYDGQLSG
jgi:hypothetical protein